MVRETLGNLTFAACAALALGACGSIVPTGPGGGASARAPSSDATGSTRASPRRVTSAPRGVAERPEIRACIGDLNAAGARFSALADQYGAPGCNVLGAVRLSSLTGDQGDFGVSNLGPVKCELANTFGEWARFGVDRAARQILGSPLARIETMGSYACRNIGGSNRRSAHARAAAIDVSAFVLADGRRVTLAQDWNGGTAAEREFLRVVQASACKRFGTVLGPEYNRAHHDHFHLEDPGRRFCR
ncbi:extensin family protein [Erythrobacter sp.]|jgi:hypothetical protein|uniref:extensin family protein n=1 Tax=Erythrobacter sp. TaxID=1042 RepID=UPI002ECB1681|nr:extensin family protein [Erythrobacter sp.]